MSSIWASSIRRTRSIGSSSIRGTAWQSSRRHYRDGRLTASQARDQEDHEHQREHGVHGGTLDARAVACALCRTKT